MIFANPFSITFGREPNFSIPRQNILDEIYASFSSAQPASQVYIITGVRGSGKTVSMASVADHYKNQEKWVVVELNPESDMLEQLASKIYDEGNLKKLFVKPDFNFSFHGFGFSISGKEPISSISTLLKQELECLKSKGIRLLITVDEAISNQFMKVFAHEFQSFMRNNYEVFLLMTGLFNNISQLENQKSLTFLYRAPKIYMTELNPLSVANSYKTVFGLDNDRAIALAKYVNGYAYAYQVLGYILFKTGKSDIDEAVQEEFDETMLSRAYGVIYSELSDKEKSIILSATKSSRNADIIEDIGIDKTQLSAYKRRLVLKGILTESKTEIKFALPRFSEFLQFYSHYLEN